jgi:hypothetical protein
MAKDIPASARDPRKIERVVRSLNVLDIDVKRLDQRVARAKAIGVGDTAICIIDIECCIIDCSSCAANNEVVILPETPGRLKGFAFKLPRDAADRNAPVYYMPETDLRTAFRIGHKSVKVPGSLVEGRVLGLAGEVLTAAALESIGTAATAPVIALTPKGKAAVR